VGSKEIDFVAVKDGMTTYVQVAFQLPNNTRETDNLLAIRDGYKKIVVTQNWEDVGQVDGIPIIHVADLLEQGI
jgi:predicted AAA+ superfamily ATPase